MSLSPDVSCPLCNFGDESVDHLFTSCFVAAAVWQFISTWCKRPNIFAFSYKDLQELHLSAGLSEASKDAFQGIIIIVCWRIWKARNELKFAGKSLKIENITSEIKALNFLWFSNRSKCRNITWENWCKFVIM
ncbi:hypothetical protein HanIR_Chr01g0001991 [Helianthus annuus]|nr:hypothetical protein HanIR_Chr01g0001991 [Helianthus annuus]